MKKNALIETQILHSIESEELSIVSDVSETVIDSILNDGFLKDIPGISLLTGIVKLSENVKEKNFVRKLLEFLRQFNDIPQTERKAFLKKMDDDPKYSEKVGEKLLVIVDQIDDLDKATVIGRLFRAAIEEKLSFENFLLLASIVNRSFFPYIELLTKRTRGDDEWTNHLQGLGLMTVKLRNDASSRLATLGGESSAPELILVSEINNVARSLVKYGFPKTPV